jgi:ABC-type nitrate/sulfonate/bicarbonate transport system substrate-binding protein
MKRIAALAALATCLALASASAEPLKIRIQYAGSVPGMFGPMIEAGTELGVYRHYGKSYTVESIVVRGSGPALTALAAKEIDIASLSYEAIGHAVLSAKLDVKVIGDVLGTGMNGWGDDYFIGRKGEFKSLKDLKGRVAGVISRGSAPDTALNNMGNKFGLRHGVDYSIVEIGFPQAIATLESKRADLVTVVQPFTTIAQRTGKFDVVFSIAESLGPTESVVWTALGDYIAKNRAALVDFMEDHIRFRHYLFNPNNRAAALAFTAKITKRPAALFEPWLFTIEDHWRHPDARVDEQLLQKNLENAVALGLLKERVQLAPDHLDMSLIDDGLKRIR